MALLVEAHVRRGLCHLQDRRRGRRRLIRRGADDHHELLDLPRLCDPHRQHQPSVQHRRHGDRKSDRHDLGWERATEQAVEHRPQQPRDRGHDHGRCHDPGRDHHRLGTLEAASEAATQPVELEHGHHDVRRGCPDDQPGNAGR